MNDLKCYREPWFPIYNSVLFLLLGIWFLYLYGIVHSEIIGNNYQALSEGVKTPLLSLLAKLGAYRLFGFLSLVSAIWGALCKSKKALIFCVTLGIMALFVIVVTL